MKKILWILTTLAGVAILVLAGGAMWWTHRYGMLGLYASGGVLSENQSHYDVHSYDIRARIDPDTKSIQGDVGIELTRKNVQTDRIELDLVDRLTVSRVTVNDVPAPYEHADNKLIVNLAAEQDSLLNVRVVYGGRPPEAIYPPWIGGFNWSTDSAGYHWIGLSCQGEGAKVWIPCKDHPSDEADSVRLSITVPKPYFCASNGLLTNIDSSTSDGITYTWETRYPINNYNITLNIGRFLSVDTTYLTEDSIAMPVVFYYLPQSETYARRHLEMAVDMLRTYRKLFGEYPFAREKFAIVETAYLGMEHQTINSYGNRFRYQTLNGHVFDELMLHEMGHEWWGNKITVADWADFWIHEGICVYSEALYHREKSGESGYHERMNSAARGITNKSPIIPNRHARSTEAYTSDIYTKGAMAMHSLRYLMGDSLFFPFVYRLAADSAFPHFVSTDDVLQRVARTSGTVAVDFLHRFLHTTEIPEVRIKRISATEFEIRCSYRLPMDVLTDQGVSRQMLGPEPIRVSSSYVPRIDERNWYYKRVMEEQ